MKPFWTKLLGSLKRAVYPEDVTCNRCGAELFADTRYHFCADCMEKLPFIEGKRCVTCGVPIADEADYCINCMNYSRAIAKCRTPLLYEGIATELIYALKFGGKRYLVKDFSAMLADEYVKEGFCSDLVCSVPMTEKEKKRRGFNQSELLAKATAERLKLPYEALLTKVRDTSDQKKLGGRERAKNMEGAFTAAGGSVKGKTVLIVDDVFTTGATANECAKALKKAGARRVEVLAVCITKPRIYGEKQDQSNC